MTEFEMIVIYFYPQLILIVSHYNKKSFTIMKYEYYENQTYIPLVS